MRTATTVEASGAPWRETVDFAVEAERIGVDVCWVAEAWGSDAPSALGYLAARTSRMVLGSGVLQVGTRSPVLLAQTALTLADMSGGRFLLGLGSSGPQVIEGLHGVPFAHPLGRTRETVAVIRSVFAGEKVVHDGRHVRIPLPGGDGRPMRTSTVPNPDIPVYLATLSPRMLALTGEVADGWLGTSFVPEGAAAYLDPLRAGAAAAGRTLADLDLCQGAEVAFAADEGELAAMVAARRPGIAFSLGGMGTAAANFYFDAYRRQGWGERADRVRALWLAGDRAGAADAVDDAMVLGTTLLGTEDGVRARLADWRAAGVTTVRLYPAGGTRDARLETLGRAVDLVRALG
ncbi:LLM class flavin-dependent oxidoreductase [Pseudonocardia sp.]|uniref:LLM class flavin-dependent oxidoreductase n=1 Tax=Pseudonocardia sp. TaxID=60912 RepID=UPI0026110340|nr:LLM class flavin-dependent oxidoreductase [Pseudonocardia sp.]